MKRAARYTTSLVIVHLFVNIAHGLAHRELRVGLDLLGSAFVIVVVLILPLVAMGLVWTTRKRVGLALLAGSMLGSLFFGLYHHFLVGGPDYVPAQVGSAWGITFNATAIALLITEAIGIYIGMHFLWRTTPEPARGF